MLLLYKYIQNCNKSYNNKNLIKRKHLQRRWLKVKQLTFYAKPSTLNNNSNDYIVSYIVFNISTVATSNLTYKHPLILNPTTWIFALPFPISSSFCHPNLIHFHGWNIYLRQQFPQNGKLFQRHSITFSPFPPSKVINSRLSMEQLLLQRKLISAQMKWRRMSTTILGCPKTGIYLFTTFRRTKNRFLQFLVLKRIDHR